MIRLLYFGPQKAGSTAFQRLEAFQRCYGVDAIGLDSEPDALARVPTLWQRARWKIGLPVDANKGNEVLVTTVANIRPNCVFVDNVKTLRRSTLKTLRKLGVERLAYYSPDDIMGTHNLSLPLKHSLPEWDIVFTTKSFNLEELRRHGAANPYLIGKAFDPFLHRPMESTIVGAEYEKFDAVFVGAWEQERCESIRFLAESGMSIVVYGGYDKRWRKSAQHSNIELRSGAFGIEYVRALHIGKISLCFLRKLSRDLITQRSMEITAAGRPMVGEKTSEHDSHFRDGREYLGFRSDAELLRQIRTLLSNPADRFALGSAGRTRCVDSQYSTDDRAAEMIRSMMQVNKRMLSR